MTARETIYSQVFGYFSALTAGGSPLFKTATRKLKVWADVAAEDQPALLMRERSETKVYRKGLPTRWQLNIDLYLYVHTGAQNDPDLIPAQIMNPLLDAVDVALTVDDISNNTCTLGGIVSHCAVDGPIEIYTGDLGDESAAIIPLTVLVPA